MLAPVRRSWLDGVAPDYVDRGRASSSEGRANYFSVLDDLRSEFDTFGTLVVNAVTTDTEPRVADPAPSLEESPLAPLLTREAYGDVAAVLVFAETAPVDVWDEVATVTRYYRTVPGPDYTDWAPGRILADGLRHGPEELLDWFDVVVTILSSLSPDRALAEEVRSLDLLADNLLSPRTELEIADVLDAIEPDRFPNLESLWLQVGAQGAIDLRKFKSIHQVAIAPAWFRDRKRQISSVRLPDSVTELILHPSIDAQPYLKKGRTIHRTPG